jgi:hypothetical protein
MCLYVRIYVGLTFNKTLKYVRFVSHTHLFNSIVVRKYEAEETKK